MVGKSKPVIVQLDLEEYNLKGKHISSHMYLLLSVELIF